MEISSKKQIKKLETIIVKPDKKVIEKLIQGIDLSKINEEGIGFSGPYIKEILSTLNDEGNCNYGKAIEFQYSRRNGGIFCLPELVDFYNHPFLNAEKFLELEMPEEIEVKETIDIFNANKA